MHRRQFVAIASGMPFGSSQRASGQGTPTGRSWPALRRLLAEYLGAKKLAGGAFSVAHGGSPVSYHKAGRVSLDADGVFDEDSVCRIYSMTKPITGLAAILLVKQVSCVLMSRSVKFFPSCGRCTLPSTPARVWTPDRRDRL